MINFLFALLISCGTRAPARFFPPEKKNRKVGKRACALSFLVVNWGTTMKVLNPKNAKIAVANLADHCDVNIEEVRDSYYKAQDGVSTLLELLDGLEHGCPQIAKLERLIKDAEDVLNNTHLGYVL